MSFLLHPLRKCWTLRSCWWGNTPLQCIGVGHDKFSLGLNKIKCKHIDGYISLGVVGTTYSNSVPCNKSCGASARLSPPSSLEPQGWYCPQLPYRQVGTSLTERPFGGSQVPRPTSTRTGNLLYDLIKQSQFVRIASRKVHHHLKFMDAFFYWPLVATLTVWSDLHGARLVHNSIAL